MADGYDRWIEQRGRGWYVCEVGGGWSMTQGPYRWWIVAVLVGALT
jgi:hypothetical protein